MGKTKQEISDAEYAEREREVWQLHQQALATVEANPDMTVEEIWAAFKPAQEASSALLRESYEEGYKLGMHKIPPAELTDEEIEQAIKQDIKEQRTRNLRTIKRRFGVRVGSLVTPVGVDGVYKVTYIRSKNVPRTRHPVVRGVRQLADGSWDTTVVGLGYRWVLVTR